MFRTLVARIKAMEDISIKLVVLHMFIVLAYMDLYPWIIQSHRIVSEVDKLSLLIIQSYVMILA